MLKLYLFLIHCCAYNIIFADMYNYIIDHSIDSQLSDAILVDNDRETAATDSVHVGRGGEG